MSAQVTDGFEVLYNFTASEDMAYFDCDLGKTCKEIILAVYGRYAADTANLTINLCSSASFTETGQNNKAVEAAFYNNNDRGVAAHLIALGGGNYVATNAGTLIVSTDRMAVSSASFGGVFFETVFPETMRYIHIGTLNQSVVKFKAGTKVKIWGR